MIIDYYEVLKVSRSSSQEDIKRAYRKLAAVHHPDRGGTAEGFKRIHEAYEYLSKHHRMATPETPFWGPSGMDPFAAGTHHVRYSTTDAMDQRTRTAQFYGYNTWEEYAAAMRRKMADDMMGFAFGADSWHPFK